MIGRIGFEIAFFLFWVNLFSAAAACQSQMSESLIARNRERLRQVLSQDATPGAAIAVIRNGRIVWSEGFGMSNLETNTPVTPETRFGIGSISKSLTMVLALRLAEEGLLNLDAPLETYLPEFPHKNQGVTIRLIGKHLSGYGDDFDNNHYYNAKRYESTEQVLQEFYREKLAAKPGEKSIYGTTTFTLVAAVIEKVTKLDFVTAMNRYVLQPLQLKNTLANDKRPVIPNRTAFYIKDNAGNTINGEYVDPSFKLAGAGFLATAEDLAKFGAALLAEGFLRKSSLEQIFQPGETSGGEKTPFGLGFRIVKAAEGKEIIYQPGGGVGISSVLFLDRQKKISIAILTNQTGAPVGNLTLIRGIADSF